MVNAQLLLDLYYPNQIRSEITVLNISLKSLKGFLKLEYFFNLKELNCSANKITSLDLSSCWWLEKLDCSDNKIVELVFPNLSYEKITEISLVNNNFPQQGLSRFTHFKNLRKLRIGNNKKGEVHQGFYNRFIGSLRPLGKLTKLEELDISNTDIDQGLEYLPESLRKITYLGKRERSEQVRSNKLLVDWQPYFRQGLGNDNYYDVTEWRKVKFPYYTHFLVSRGENEIQRQKITELEWKLEQTSGIITDQQITELEQELAIERENFQNLQNELIEIQVNLNQVKLEKTNLQKQKRELEETEIQFRKEINNKKQTIHEQEGVIHSFQEQIERIHRQNQNLEEKLEKIQEENLEFQITTQSYKVANNTLKSEWRKTQEKLENNQQEKAESVNLFLTIQSMNEKFKKTKRLVKQKLGENKKKYLNKLLETQEQLNRLEKVDVNEESLEFERTKINKYRQKLSEQLTEQEIQNICQLKKSLTELKEKLKQEQSFQTQIQILPKRN